MSPIEFPSDSVDLNDISDRNEFGLSDISYRMNIIALAGWVPWAGVPESTLIFYVLVL